MKAGRNHPCPCGSGKKYKQCCRSKDQETEARQAAAVPPSPRSDAPRAPARAAKAPAPPPDPEAERWRNYWREFKAQDAEGRIAIFHKTLEDVEEMSDDLAFELLNALHTDAVKGGNRTRFAEHVSALRQRWPEVFEEGAHYYLSWRLLDALAEGRQEDVPTLARELAVRGEHGIDTFSRALDALEYHGQLSVLVEVLRIAWPNVKPSKNVVPWGVEEFAEKGASHEIFAYLEHTAAPDPTDPVLLDRIKFFVEEPAEGHLGERLSDLTGTSGRQWQATDFDLKPPRKRSRDEWGDDEEDKQVPDEGALNLSRLICEFVGYLRRQEGVPFPRGEMLRDDLFRYFLLRHEGDLDPRPSMIEQAMKPKLKLPKPPRPTHPLCPERITLDVHLNGMMGMLNGLYHRAAALFLAMPAWLRFLEYRGLIDAETRRKVAAELPPLHAMLMRYWENYDLDPTLHREGQAWPADAAKELPSPTP